MSRSIIIAEAGVNHNGSLQTAKQLVDAAAEAGVDYVKFQTFEAANLVTSTAEKARYQKENTGSDNSQLNMLKKLELSKSAHIELIKYCGERNIKFLSTAFDMQSVEFLASLGLEIWKIPSGEITNYPYLKKIAAYGEEVILSTGMCTVEDIENALSVLTRYGTPKENITVLHCNTQYPTPMRDVNLRAMCAIKDLFGVRVGYSDHTLGIEIPVAAAALGATVIEKHFTLNREMEGPDHRASLEPGELKKMVKAIRNVEEALGSGRKAPSVSERDNQEIVRKSIVAARRILKGEVFSDENLTAKRPANGLSPMRWEEVVGRTAIRDFEADEVIEI